MATVQAHFVGSTRTTLAMPASSLLTLIDDIATILDDIAVLTKLATKKTAGVLGDDLAVNAEQVTGLSADRELPVVWAVAKGSALNKAILVPVALGISAFVPWAVTPLLMVGGAFLCFEGCEKVFHKFVHPKQGAEQRAQLAAAAQDANIDLKALEKAKVRGAVRTDFILSAEIVTIALGTVANAPFVTQVGVLIGISALMTVGVYGFVAGIVKLDDLGLYLTRRQHGTSTGFAAKLGAGILWLAPHLMKALGVGGTLAMFLVGGSILSHGIHVVGHWFDRLGEHAAGAPGIGALLGDIVPIVLDLALGVVAGALVLLTVTLVQRSREPHSTA